MPFVRARDLGQSPGLPECFSRGGCVTRAFVLAATCAYGLLTASVPSWAATVLVTGSNRGLGYEFVRQYAARGDTVIATTRHPQDAKELRELAAKNKNIAVESLDVTDQAQIDALAAKYKSKPIDILINNAGAMGPPSSQAMGSIDHKLFQQVMDTNVYGVMAVTMAFKDNIIASEQKKVIAITSVAGSMTGPWERLGGIYFYRASKAALNNVMRGMGIDLRKQGVIFGLVAPGAADTDMLRNEFGFKGRMTPASDSVAGMMKNIDAFTLENSKKPIDFDGKVIDW
ncbi:MAG: SDR family oxidoreductase [Rhodospirillaceae bacterium]|nr:SDR family oxidoreductase [Rhodospirillaceae bacterium]